VKERTRKNFWTFLEIANVAVMSSSTKKEIRRNEKVCRD
jgi:hypothetical protein